MGILTEDMKSIIAEANLGFVATVNADGSPSLSPKSSVRVYQDDQLIFADIASPGTVENLARDPRIEINCVSVLARRGYRFAGKASIHPPGSNLHADLEKSVQHEHGDTFPVHHAVLIEIDEAKELLSPAYVFGDGVTEAALRRTYKKRYGMENTPTEEAE